MSNLNSRLTEILELAGKSLPIEMTYDECVQLWFTNKFRSGEITQLAMFMWPGHDIEDTKEVEDSYEATGKLCVASRTLIPQLVEALKLVIDREKLFVKLGMIADGFDGNEINAKLADLDSELEAILRRV